MKAFFDSNVLVYAFSIDARRDRAIEVIALGGLINVQVLNEFTNVLHKKQRLSWPVIEAAVAAVHSMFNDIQMLTPNIHKAALAIARDHTINFYDALIIAAALDAKCDTLFSEDLQNGRLFGRLEVVNPFG